MDKCNSSEINFSAEYGSQNDGRSKVDKSFILAKIIYLSKSEWYYE